MYCTYCGEALNDGQKFCTKCGHKSESTVNENDNLDISKLDAGDQNHNTKNSKKKITIIVGVIAIIVVIAVVSIFAVPQFFKSPQDYMASGNYEKAYEVAEDGIEKADVLTENLVAFFANYTSKQLKDPSSFSLLKAWVPKNTEPTSFALYISAKNSYGATVTEYVHYQWNERTMEYDFLTFSDLDLEEYYSWEKDNYSDASLEKAIRNFARMDVSNMIEKNYEISTESIENINNLFEKGLLEKIELLEENQID